MSTMTVEQHAPEQEPSAPKKGFRPSGLFLFVLLLGVIMIAEILFFTIAHLLPDDRVDSAPAVKEPSSTTDG